MKIFCEAWNNLHEFFFEGAGHELSRNPIATREQARAEADRRLNREALAREGRLAVYRRNWLRKWLEQENQQRRRSMKVIN